MEIHIDCTYRLFPGETVWPLPWGMVYVPTWARVSGHPRSSRAGAWYWKAPDFAQVGYGQYQPYLEFLFKGMIERTARRDDIPAEGAGFRIGARTWLYFRGEFRPTPRWQLEKELSIRCRMDMAGGEDQGFPLRGTQGHLTIRYYPDDQVSSTIRLLERIARSSRLREVFPHRRRILNHQLFGADVRVYYLPYIPPIHGSDDGHLLQWLVWAPDGAHVVSPDHIDQPVRLGGGLYWAAHPRPTKGGMD
jgi:hypothetical protein